MWTMHLGEVFVACKRDCTPMFPGFDLPLYAKGSEFTDETWGTEENPKRGSREPLEGRGVVPLEGGAARMSATKIHEPPAGWLSTLWIGGPTDGKG